MKNTALMIATVAMLGACASSPMMKVDNAALPEAVRAQIAATSPLNRLADPAEMAAAVAFLASTDCRFMTGAELLVDGGALAIPPGF